jgi:hypothetical protein
MQLALSMYSIGVLIARSDNRSDRRHLKHTKSLFPTFATMISVSVVERAVGFCSRLVQDIAPSSNVAIMPVVERLVSLTAAKSALLKHVRQNF